MATAPDQFPNDMDALKAALIEARARLSGAEAMIEHLQLVIAKMKRERFSYDMVYGDYGVLRLRRMSFEPRRVPHDEASRRAGCRKSARPVR